jgi:2-polyprenyl-3-methyl-5-hydroxy-6-metoxy-1,4-benzoquinol methylase
MVFVHVYGVARFIGLRNLEPELIELFFSRMRMVGCGSGCLTERMAEMASVTSVMVSAKAAPMAV